MRSNRSRIAVAVGAIAGIVVLFVVLSGGNNSSSSNKPSSPSAAQGSTQAGQAGSGAAPAVINVIDGKPAGGIKKLDYTKGDQVRFTVHSDVGDEIHVHGYDFHKDVKAGGSVSFSFPATIEGVFVIELEAKGEQIAELRVTPS